MASIAEVAAEFKLTHRALRFYEGRGLISPQRAGRHRIYSDRDRNDVRLIVRLTRMGFTLDQIKRLIGKRPVIVDDESRLGQLAIMQERLQEIAAGIGLLEALDETQGRVDLVGNVARLE